MDAAQIRCNSIQLVRMLKAYPASPRVSADHVREGHLGDQAADIISYNALLNAFGRGNLFGVLSHTQKKG